VQEALTNVVRHASASAIVIAINGTSRSTSVKVGDNGRGITAKQMADPTAIGLLGMRERAELIGATLTIASKPRKGTTVVLTIARSRQSPSRA
jgi:signal transduction histidine kinase